MFYHSIYKLMPAPMLHKDLWPTVGHLVHTNATREGCMGTTLLAYCSAIYPQAGTDISTSLLAPASDVLKKGLSGKDTLVLTCPNRQADFLNAKHIVNGPNTQSYANNAT